MKMNSTKQSQPMPMPSGSSHSSFRPSSPEVDGHSHPDQDSFSDSKQNVSASSNQKRKSLKDYWQPKAKRPRTTRYNEEYRQLLNETIQDVSTQTEVPEKIEETPFPASQIGASYWTSEEKDAFFRALPVLGKDNVTGIASRIRTKSSLEVTLYLQLLSRAMVDRYLHRRDPSLLGLIDMPAAFEISQDCCDRLDQEAALLESRQVQEEERREKRKWDDLWLLRPDIGRWVESKLGEGIEGVNEVVNRLPAARLLKLDSWLELSERIFMNPAPPREDENWHCISETDEPPSIRSTAFTDFANLTVSITERLVQATLFQAQSRCRAIDSKHLERGYSVQVRDVHSACQVLGMELNSRHFWIHAARRCGLNVFKHISEMNSNEDLPMTYGEVEEGLSEKKSKSENSSKETEEDFKAKAPPNSKNNRHITSLERSRTVTTASPPEASSPTESSSPGHQSDPPDSPIDLSESDIDKPYSHEARLLAKRRTRRELHRAQDVYMEVLDMRNSLAEEDRLWKMLGQERPYEGESVELPTRPARDRKIYPDLVDWRDRTEYWSEWETMKRPIGEDMFSRWNRQRKESSHASISKAEPRSRDPDDIEMVDGADSDGEDDSSSIDTFSGKDTSEER